MERRNGQRRLCVRACVVPSLGAHHHPKGGVMATVSLVVVLVVVVWIVVAFGMSGLDHFRVAMSPEQKQRTANPLVLLASISFLPLPSPRLLFLCTEEGSI